MIQEDIGRLAFDGQSVLVTGGTGSFGRHFIDALLRRTQASRVVVFSRDEHKQFEMQQEYPDEPRLRFFLGDIRDLNRLMRAFDGVDVVVHAAALKHIPAAEYNPFEFVKTNVIGAQNVVEAAIDCGVTKVIALSTDKASSPINLYGATKLVGDRLFVAGNVYTGRKPTRFAVIRYGNVVASRGSVIWKLRHLERGATFHMTDARMTRFWITLTQAVRFTIASLDRMRGGEIFIPKLPSMRLADLIEAVAPHAEVTHSGVRPGEKLHEEMISLDEARRTVDRGNHFVILPDIIWSDQELLKGTPVPDGFRYASDVNDDWLDAKGLATLLDE